jgi:S1-C subfamily serine protease
MAVRRGSPAFAADMLPGDVILSIDGRQILDMESYRDAIYAAYGKQSTALVLRAGQQMSIPLELPANGVW